MSAGGHFTGCPETPDESPKETSDAAWKAAEKIVWKMRIDYHDTQYIAEIIDEAISGK